MYGCRLIVHPFRNSFASVFYSYCLIAFLFFTWKSSGLMLSLVRFYSHLIFVRHQAQTPYGQSRTAAHELGKQPLHTNIWHSIRYLPVPPQCQPVLEWHVNGCKCSMQAITWKHADRVKVTSRAITAWLLVAANRRREDTAIIVNTNPEPMGLYYSLYKTAFPNEAQNTYLSSKVRS